MNTITKPDNFTRFAQACRYNSGKALCDSGGESGRHWQRPAIDQSSPGVSLEVRRFEWKGEPRTEVSATIEAAHFLDANFEVLADVQDRFDAWVEEQPDDESWFELGQRFAEEELGLHSQARDNVYNGENDLSQVYVWEVFTPEEKPSDWLYADDAVVVIHVHTGCDVRGGYSYPLFCRSTGDYSIPVDYCAEFSAYEGTDAEGNELTHEELQGIYEQWQNGYGPHPETTLNEDLAEVIDGSVDGDKFTAKLKTGETVRIQATYPGLW
jgi:hypothetical protein